MKLQPCKVTREVRNRLLATKPPSYLLKVVTTVTGTVGVLSIVNMKAFGSFSVISISRPKLSDHVCVVKHGMDFRNLEVDTKTELHKDVLVGVELSDGVF